tara:strand:- start:64135 stop:64242 length:108 start_codon:yes stop_codon:yes gene_type:complete
MTEEQIKQLKEVGLDQARPATVQQIALHNSFCNRL